MSFQERSKLGMENLSKQLPVTLEQANYYSNQIFFIAKYSIHHNSTYYHQQTCPFQAQTYSSN